MEKYFENYKTSEITNTRRVINTPSDTTRTNFLYIQEAGYLKSLTPHLSKRKGLQSYLFLIVLSGSGTVTYDGIAYHVKSNDCFLLHCMHEYSHISSEIDPWELLWIHFDGSNADAYYRLFLEKRAIDRRSPANQNNCFQSEYIAEIIDTIHEIITINEHKNDDTDIMTAKLITDVLTRIITNSRLNDNSNASMSSSTTQKLYSIATYINKNFVAPINLEELSKEFFISKYYLVRQFKKKFGVTIVSYIQTKRITYAKELLRYSDFSIEEIGNQCGIGDASYFNKVFKKMENMTASEYRKMW